MVTVRCLSSTQAANAAVRVTPVIMGFGQGAGIAAAICAAGAVDVRCLNTDFLRQQLLKQGVF